MHQHSSRNSFIQMVNMATKVMCLVLVCMVVVVPSTEAITCGQVVSTLAPCLGYLTRGGVVPPACCGGVIGLNNVANSTPDRRTTCGCLKVLYSSVSGVNLGFASSLPGKCGVNIPYKISPSTDCSKVT